MVWCDGEHGSEHLSFFRGGRADCAGIELGIIIGHPAVSLDVGSGAAFDDIDPEGIVEGTGLLDHVVDAPVVEELTRAPAIGVGNDRDVVDVPVIQGDQQGFFLGQVRYRLQKKCTVC